MMAACEKYELEAQEPVIPSLGSRNLTLVDKIIHRYAIDSTKRGKRRSEDDFLKVKYLSQRARIQEHTELTYADTRTTL